MKTQKVQIETIKLDPSNPRSITKEAFERLKKSITDFPEMQSVKPLVVADGYALAGNMRLLAYKDLGYRELHVLDVSEWSQAKRDEFMIKDNTHYGTWDYDALANEWETLPLTDWGLDVWEPEVEEIKGLTDEDDVPEAPQEPITKLGDVWILGEHRVMCGDSTSKEAVEILMDGEKADMVFTDPPYGINVVQGGKVGRDKSFGTVGGEKIVKAKTYSKVIGDNTTEAARNFYNTCVNMGFENFIIFGGNYFTDFLTPSMCWIVWDKENTGNFADVELAWTSFDKAAKLYKWQWNGMIRKGDKKEEGKTRVHPTQKPVGMFEEIFNDFEFKCCFDGFLGSGSTLIAAEKTNRKCYGMELDPKYCDVIIKRWEDFTGKKATREIDDLEVITQAH